jgi:hypothetical protein
MAFHIQWCPIVAWRMDFPKRNAKRDKKNNTLDIT